MRANNRRKHVSAMGWLSVIVSSSKGMARMTSSLDMCRSSSASNLMSVGGRVLAILDFLVLLLLLMLLLFLAMLVESPEMESHKTPKATSMLRVFVEMLPASETSLSSSKVVCSRAL